MEFQETVTITLDKYEDLIAREDLNNLEEEVQVWKDFYDRFITIEKHLSNRVVSVDLNYLEEYIKQSEYFYLFGVKAVDNFKFIYHKTSGGNEDVSE